MIPVSLFIFLTKKGNDNGAEERYKYHIYLSDSSQIGTSFIWNNIYVYVVKQQNENKIYVDKNMLCTKSIGV